MLCKGIIIIIMFTSPLWKLRVSNEAKYRVWIQFLVCREINFPISFFVTLHVAGAGGDEDDDEI